jgi:hypothetical protein
VHEHHRSVPRVVGLPVQYREIVDANRFDHAEWRR